MSSTPDEPFARGRTADVFVDGPGRVQRVYRDGRDASGEADVMEHLARFGYPVPQVYAVDGPSLVLERVPGPTLAEHVGRRPWSAAGAGRLLVELLARLAGVPAPDGLPEPFGPGSLVLHLDLHPQNVLLGPQGPVVIDWALAARGPVGVDRAQTWLVTATSEVDAPTVLGPLVRRVQARVARPVRIGDSDEARAARTWLPAVARRRLEDPHVTARERARVRRVLARD